MPVFRFLFYAVISVASSKVFFNSSVVGTTVIFCVLNYISVTSKEEYAVRKKMPTLAYGVLLAVCVIGIMLIIVGNNFIQKDALIIIGAMLFALTISVLVINQGYILLGYLKNKMQNSK